MYITGIYYQHSQKIGLKDNIFYWYLYKVYLITTPMMVYQDFKP